MATHEIKKIIKIGNAYAVTISKAMLCYLNLKPKDYVMLNITNKKLVVKNLNDYYEEKAERG